MVITVLCWEVTLLHNNTTTHTAGLAQALIENLKRDIVTHPLNAPNFVLSDYHLFPTLKFNVGSQRFNSHCEMKIAVGNFFANQDMQWYAMGIDKLTIRLNNCLNFVHNFDEK